MKILYCIDSLRAGGKERRCVELLKVLKSSSSVDCELIVMNDSIHYTDVLSLGIPIHYVIRKRKKDLTVFRKFYKICKSYRPDAVHCWDSMTTCYAIPSCKLLGIKLINGMICNAPEKKNFFDKNHVRAKITFPFSDLIIGNSKAGLEIYNSPPNKSRVIYNGYDFKRNGGFSENERIRKELNISTKFVVGMIASFSKSKDYKTYYQAASKVLEKRKDVTFLSIGNNTDSLESKDLVDINFKEEFFRFLGKKSAIELYINTIDIGILATFTEGISNSIMEFMAAGKPVIATCGGGTKEIVDDGKTGFLVNTSDAEGLAAKIELLLDNSDLRLKMGQEGQSRIRNVFSIDEMAKKFITLYEQHNFN